MSAYSDLAIKGLKVLIEDYETLQAQKNALYAALILISEMGIESEMDRLEVLTIARNALNDCD